MIQTINFYEFEQGFRIRPDNFTYKGLLALFDYLEDYEEDSGEKMEFDPIALCGEYTEYEDLSAFCNDYSATDMEDDCPHCGADLSGVAVIGGRCGVCNGIVYSDYNCMKDVEDQTQVIPIDSDRFIIRRF